MNIGLIDVDGKNFPNLAIMKLSAYHKNMGNTVSWYYPIGSFDKVYASKVFTFSQMPQINHEVIIGGSGINQLELPEEIEHMRPDYSFYKTENTAFGFLTRGCPRNCAFCIVSKKEGNKSVLASPLKEFWKDQKRIVLLDPNILAYENADNLLNELKETRAFIDFTQGIDLRLLTDERIKLLSQIKTKYIHASWDGKKQEKEVLEGLKKLIRHIPAYKIIIYCLTGFDTDISYDIYRVEYLRCLGVKPYIMIYEKEKAPKQIRYLQRYCNNKMIFYSEPNFKNYYNSKKKAQNIKNDFELWRVEV
ncbi:MAG: hypothetical protein Ta2B_09340 [Termitinemataceae bacterium]|nr:MAG: hypothetical protein Ta2B_09340 [Termitinemataceae bacterium]